MKIRSAIPYLLSIASVFALERPTYDVLQKQGKMELRRYADIPVVSTPMAGMDNQDGSFMKLFRYIQGNNAAEQKIKMTAPVFMETTHRALARSGSGSMSFMLPSKVAAGGAPAPQGKGIELRKLGGGKIAVIRFKGHKSEAKRAAAANTLKTWIKQNGWTATGQPFFAYYNPPWTPEIFRRNEVWLRLIK